MCRDRHQAGSCALTSSANHLRPLQDSEFQAWFESSQDWLQPYAAFLFLKDLFGSAEHWRWGALAEATPEAIKRLVSPDREFHSAIRFTYWLQWHLHRQLLAASRHAASRGVALKGDLPIGEQFTLSRQPSNCGAWRAGCTSRASLPSAAGMECRVLHRRWWRAETLRCSNIACSVSLQLSISMQASTCLCCTGAVVLQRTSLWAAEAEVQQSCMHTLQRMIGCAAGTNVHGVGRCMHGVGRWQCNNVVACVLVCGASHLCLGSDYAACWHAHVQHEWLTPLQAVSKAGLRFSSLV